MSIKTPSEHSDPTEDVCQQSSPVTGENLPEVEDDSGDRFSISSVSPGPKQDSLGRLTSDSTSGEVNRLGMLSLSQDSLGNMALHTSPPLESIRELDEAEEPGSGLRSPGDGAVRVKGLTVDLDLERRDFEALSDPGSGDGGLQGPCFVPTLGSAVLKSLHAPTDVTSSSRVLSDDGCSLEYHHRAQDNCPASGSLNICGIEERLIDHKAEQSVDALGHVPECSLILPPKAQELEAKPEDQSKKIPLCTETGEKDSRDREGGHLGTQPRSSDKEIDQVHTITNVETDKGSLIDVLTACKSKVEQLEELKQSSQDLTAQLQSAQAMATGLQCRVQWLEQEQSLNQREMDDLLGELERTRGALEEKNAEMDRASAQIQLLQLRLGEQQQQNLGVGDSEGLANGHTTIDVSQLPRQSSNDSRVCRLL